MSVSNLPSPGQILQRQMGNSLEYRYIQQELEDGLGEDERGVFDMQVSFCLLLTFTADYFFLTGYASTILPLGFGGSFRMSFFHVLAAHSVLFHREFPEC